MLFAKIIFLFSFLFLGGVLIASLNFGLGVLFLISVLVFLITYFKFHLSKKYVLIFILALFFGFFYFNFRIFYEEKNKNLVYHQKIEFRGKTSSEVLNFNNYQKFKVKILEPLWGEVEILAPLGSVYHYGDILKIQGEINRGKNKFSLPMVAFPKINYLENKPDSKVFVYLLKIKNYFLNQFKRYLFYDEAALMSGILLGDRSGFSNEFKKAMNNSGTTHIVALSGYNVGILILGLNFILGSIFNRKKILWLIIIFIFMFVLMTGAEASVVRASILATLVLLARQFGRIYSFGYSVVLAAALMVLINPKILAYDLGFQLSFLSLLGISYLKPILDNFLGFKEAPGFLGWRENLTTTAGAQFAVLPLLLFNFGQISLVSFWANILILVFIPLTMFLGFLLGLFGFFEPFGFIFGIVVSFVLKYEIGVINFWGRFETLNYNFISLFLIIIFYIFLAIYALKINKLKFKEIKINV